MGTKFIFITGGVVSSVGKGVTAASLGRLLKQHGFNVAIQKLDPYINVYPGLLSPLQHGEVFVLDDGGETDLDLGHYERFIDIRLTKASSVTTGKIYQSILESERSGGFNGGTIQVIPNITNEICARIKKVADQTRADFVIVEVGGTVGDIEGEPFIEAIRQIRNSLPPEDTLNLHVTWLPYIRATDELKTKPTQHSVRTLRSMGVAPDAIIARSDFPVSQNLCQKIAAFCDVEQRAVVPMVTCKQLYEIPLRLENSELGEFIMQRMNITSPVVPDWSEWEWILKETTRKNKPEIKIGLVGKYIELHDAYLSIREAAHHASLHEGVKLDLHWIHSENLENGENWDEIKSMDGLLVPSGMGANGVKGMIQTASYARENKIPYFGICMGMEAMAIEYARSVLKMSEADSTEFNEKTENPIFKLPDETTVADQSNGMLRLGLYPARLTVGTKIEAVYNNTDIQERHSHRYEFNNDYRARFEKGGMVISGSSPDGKYTEAMEVKNHPFMIGVMFDPEFLSRPNRPHPLFSAFIHAAFTKALAQKSVPVN
ncbi:MAG: CTP synthase [Flexilinea sp.]